MFPFFVGVIILFGLALGLAFFLAQLLNNFQPSSTRIKKDLQKLRNEVDIFTADLIPWKADELELLSHNQTHKTTKRGLSTIVKGVFTSIYHEPMIAYAYKKYISSGAENAILYARTFRNEFSFRIKKKMIQVQIDGQHIGNLLPNGSLVSTTSERELANIRSDRKTMMLPIVAGERELASLNVETDELGTASRALHFVKDDLGKEEEAVVLSLSILEMVRHQLEIK